METKTTTVRVNLDFYNEVTKRGAFNTQIVEICERSIREEKIKMLDIKGIFTPNEWKGLANSLNGTLIDDYTRYSKEMLIAHNEDAELYEGSFSQFGVEVATLNKKVATLTRIQVATLFDRIEAFWYTQEGRGYELEEWSNF